MFGAVRNLVQAFYNKNTLFDFSSSELLVCPSGPVAEKATGLGPATAGQDLP